MTALPTPDDRPHVVCISGSMRFEDEMRLAAVEESVKGHVVVMPHVNMKRPLPVTLPAGHDPKPGLDKLHLAKIDLADEVLVVAPGDYIGDSTRAEIAYAERHGKPVRRWLEHEVSVSPVDTGLRERIAEAMYRAWQGSSPLSFAEQADDVRDEYLRAADEALPVFEQAHGDLARQARMWQRRAETSARDAVLNAPSRWRADNPGLIPPDDYGDDLGGWAPHRADTTRPAGEEW